MKESRIQEIKLIKDQDEEKKGKTRWLKNIIGKDLKQKKKRNRRIIKTEKVK